MKTRSDVKKAKLPFKHKTLPSETCGSSVDPEGDHSLSGDVTQTQCRDGSDLQKQVSYSQNETKSDQTEYMYIEKLPQTGQVKCSENETESDQTEYMHIENLPQTGQVKCSENETQSGETKCTENLAQVGRVKCTENVTLAVNDVAVVESPTRQIKCSENVMKVLKLMPFKCSRKIETPTIKRRTVTPSTMQLKCTENVARALQVKLQGTQSGSQVTQFFKGTQSGTQVTQAKGTQGGTQVTQLKGTQSETQVTQLKGTQSETQVTQLKGTQSETQVTQLKATQSETQVTQLKGTQSETQVIQLKGTQSGTQVTRAKGPQSETQVTQLKGNQSGTQVTQAKGTQSGTQVTRAKGTQSGTQVTRAKGTQSGTQVTQLKATQSGTQVTQLKATQSGTQVTRAKGTQSETQVTQLKGTQSGTQVTQLKATQSGTQVTRAKGTQSGNPITQVNFIVKGTHSGTRTNTQVHCSPNKTQVKQSFAKADVSAHCELPTTVNVKARASLGQIPTSMAQTIELATKSITIPPKSRMIVLNSPVMLDRKALLEASLNAVKLSQGDRGVGLTSDQKTPVFEVVQDSKQKISVSVPVDDTIGKTKEMDDVINYMNSKLQESRDPKFKPFNVSLFKSQQRESSPSKSLSIDSSPSKSLKINPSPTKLQCIRPNLAHSKPQQIETTPSKPQFIRPNLTHSKPQQMETTPSKPQFIRPNLTHSKPQQMETTSSKPQCIRPNSTHSKPQQMETTSSKPHCIKSTSLIDTMHLPDTLKKKVPIRVVIQSSPKYTTAWREAYETLNKSLMKKDGNINEGQEITGNRVSQGKRKATTSSALDVESMSAEENHCKRTKNSMISRLGDTMRAHLSVEKEKGNSNVVENLPPPNLSFSKSFATAKEESEQNRSYLPFPMEITSAAKKSNPAASESTKNGLTTIKVRENHALILTNHLKTSSIISIENLKKRFPLQCKCRPEKQRGVVADRVVVCEEGFLMVKHIPNISMLLINGTEMTGLFCGTWYVSVAEIEQKLLTPKGRHCLEVFLTKPSSKTSLRRNLRLFLMRQNITKIRLDGEFMITVKDLKKFQADMHRQLANSDLQRGFFTVAILDENVYIKIRGQMWCLHCHGHMVQESSIDVYTDLDLNDDHPELEIKDKTLLGDQRTNAGYVTRCLTLKTTTSSVSLREDHESSTAGSTATPGVIKITSDDVALPADPESKASSVVTHGTQTDSSDLNSADKKDIIKVGTVKINRSTFTAYEKNGVCFLSMHQLLMKQIISWVNIENCLYRLNVVPELPPTVVEEHLQNAGSIFVDNSWLDTATLRCLCCMEAPPGEYLSKNLIKAIISGKIVKENFEQIPESMENLGSANRHVDVRGATRRTSARVMTRLRKDKFKETTDQVKPADTQKEAAKTSYHSLSSTRSSPLEVEHTESDGGSHRELQHGHNSEAGDDHMSYGLMKRNVSGKRRQQEKLKSMEHLPLFKRGRKQTGTVLIRRWKPGMDIWKKLKIPAKRGRQQNFKALECLPLFKRRGNCSGQGLDVDGSAPRSSEDSTDSPNIGQLSPPELQNSQIVIKNEPVEYDNKLSPPDLPRVVIERETVEHEYLQEACPIGPFPVNEKLSCSPSESSRIPEIDGVAAVIYNENLNLHFDHVSPNIEDGLLNDDGFNSEPNEECSTKTDQFIKDEPDHEDCEADSSRYRHDFVMLGISSEVGYTDVGQNIKVEPSD